MTCGRIGRTAGRMLAPGVAVVAACGGGSHPPPDTEVSGSELTIELFKHVPFVDGDNDVAAVLAVQDGDGDWTELAPEGGVYRTELARERYGVAIGCRDPGDGNSLLVSVFLRGADALHTDFRARSCGVAPVELDVPVTGVPAGQFAYVSVAGQFVSGGDNATYVFHAQPGPTELFASLADSTGRITRLVRAPGFDLEPPSDPAAAPSSVAINFATQGAVPEDSDLAVALGVGDQAAVTTWIVRPGGEYPLSAGAAIPAAAASYQMPPAAQVQADDLFEISVTVGARATSVVRKAPGAVALQLPDPLVAQAPTLSLTPFVRPVFAFDTTAGALAVESFELHAHTARPVDDVYRDWTVDVSQDWLEGAASVTYTLPDLSAIAGFADYRLFDAVPIRWSVRRTESSGTAAEDGRITRSAAQEGSIDGYCGDGIIQPPETCDPPDGATCSNQCTKL